MVTPFVNDLLGMVHQEWVFFGSAYRDLNGRTNDGKKETDNGAWQRIGEYWRALGGPYARLTGKDTGWPWSAAFVSFCMRSAGAGNRFLYSASHSVYINDSIRRRNANDRTGAFIAYHPPEEALQPGDLLGYWRGPNEIGFESAVEYGTYPSHTDFVVDVRPGAAYIVGGNVSNGVTRYEIRLDRQGKLIDQRRPWFIVMRNLL